MPFFHESIEFAHEFVRTDLQTALAGDEVPYRAGAKGAERRQLQRILGRPLDGVLPAPEGE
jgi:hypothetical protein